MRAFITGGAGFIGSHLADALLATATRCSSSTTCRRARWTTSRISRAGPGFEYIIDSVDNEPLLAELVDRGDVVFHLAAAVGVKLIVEQPVHTIETNVHGTEVVLRHANKKKKLVVDRFDLGGLRQEQRRAVPGGLGPRDGPDDRSIAGRTRAARPSTSSWRWPTGRRRKLPVIIVRFFNTVGPRQTGRYGMVIPNFVRQALAGEPITVFGQRAARGGGPR